MQEYKVIVDDNGAIFWYQNDQLHRLDGPAIVYNDGTKIWYKNGKCHRVDGPAYEAAAGYRVWYLEGKSLSEEDFLKRTQPVKELTVEEISKLLGYEVKVVK